MTKDDLSSGMSKLTDGPIGLSPVPGTLIPDRPQMDPGQLDYRVYTFDEIFNGVRRTVATVLVPKTSFSTAFSVGTEYWFHVSSDAPRQTLSVTWQDHSARTALPSTVTGAPSFRMNQAAAWSTAQNVMPAPGLFVNNDIRVAIAWNISRSSTSGQWSGQLNWFNSSGLNNVFSDQMFADVHMAPQTRADFATDTVLVTKGVNWFGASVPPI